MKNIIENLKNPRFNAKGYYLMLLPLTLLGWRNQLKIREFANKHWDKNPRFMHRLYWTCNQ